ncbi:hypothetical protein CGZ93_03710 [Enemella dayhoffiae]|uniref:Uncharacterized protein n=2 Tax=Enemella dayhoffiae TaxID=2016507 RepID=A0A255HA87_9ACTN|nr:hypothetical protein CGZ93_03710 [Enemella dayhoffiae]
MVQNNYGQQKSVPVAGVLAFFFGPLGMLYSTILGAVVMFFVNLVLIFITGGLGLFLSIPAGVVWAIVAAQQTNARRSSSVTTYR